MIGVKRVEISCRGIGSNPTLHLPRYEGFLRGHPTGPSPVGMEIVLSGRPTDLSEVFKVTGTPTVDPHLNRGREVPPQKNPPQRRLGGEGPSVTPYGNHTGQVFDYYQILPTVFFDLYLFSLSSV